jgi:hypothetical protein
MFIPDPGSGSFLRLLPCLSFHFPWDWDGLADLSLRYEVVLGRHTSNLSAVECNHQRFQVRKPFKNIIPISKAASNIICIVKIKAYLYRIQTHLSLCGSGSRRAKQTLEKLKFSWTEGSPGNGTDVFEDCSPCINISLCCGERR